MLRRHVSTRTVPMTSVRIITNHTLPRHVLSDKTLPSNDISRSFKTSSTTPRGTVSTGQNTMYAAKTIRFKKQYFKTRATATRSAFNAAGHAVPNGITAVQERARRNLAFPSTVPTPSWEDFTTHHTVGHGQVVHVGGRRSNVDEDWFVVEANGGRGERGERRTLTAGSETDKRTTSSSGTIPCVVYVLLLPCGPCVCVCIR